MARRNGDRWSIAALIDFGVAMCGDARFDLPPATLLLQPGDRAIIHALLEGWKPGSASRLEELRPALMICTLLHPLGDTAACLSLVPGAADCGRWEEVARVLWPD